MIQAMSRYRAARKPPPESQISQIDNARVTNNEYFCGVNLKMNNQNKMNR